MDRFDRLVVATTITFLVAIGLFLVVAIATDTSEADCAALGGHQHTSYGYGVGFDGKYSQTSTTQCLSDDGRILEP